MKWVIAYDISDDALRTRVADRLGAIGWRVQESVFECTFDPDALPEVIGVLQRMLGESENANIPHLTDLPRLPGGGGGGRLDPIDARRGACVIA